MDNVIEVDGSYGEGGGQILRTSLTMSLLTGYSFHITNIRANRRKPGLSPQHLTAIRAAADISNSDAIGAELRSQELTFVPGKSVAGDYSFSVPTAGAMPLVLHTIALPLAFSGGHSKLTFRGGTHIAWSPCYEHLKYVWGTMLAKIGLHMNFQLHRAGYYPKGGGHFDVTIPGINHIRHVQVQERGDLKRLHLHCVLSGLADHIADREIHKVETGLSDLKLGVKLESTISKYPSCEPGNALFLIAEFKNSIAGFTSLGQRGKPAKKVAKELVKEFCDFYLTQEPLDNYLADQLLLPLAISSKCSTYRVARISNHLLTNAYILEKFKKIKICIEGNINQPGTVSIEV